MRISVPYLMVLWLGMFVANTYAVEPVYIGFDGEYGLKNSTSAQAIEQGLQIALDEINESGGVLGGRPLELQTRDNRSVPARGVDNIRHFAAQPDLVAVVAGRFSPVTLSELELVHEKQMILMNAWGSADGVTDHEYHPSYTFRVSLKDSHAMPTMLSYARQIGVNQVALIVPQTGWGRSNRAAAFDYLSHHEQTAITGEYWYLWGDDMQKIATIYDKALASGAQALILVANDIEGSLLVRYMASLPEEKRLPIISHWGVTGGKFVEACDGALSQVNIAVVQTFSFFNADPQRLASVMPRLKKRYGIQRIEDIESPVGVGHGYDIAHLLALAINKAGSTERTKIRDALEQLDEYRGLVRDYRPPFTPHRHDALQQEDVFMAKYDEHGVLHPISNEP